MFSRRSTFLRELQYQVVQRDGTRCSCCGVETLVKNSPVWRAMKEPHRYERTVDHIIPRSLGGKDEVSNLRLCCRSCNSRKGTRPVQTFGHVRY